MKKSAIYFWKQKMLILFQNWEI